jgi:hypothetical protein|tara:strand:+ start:1903 stop:2091 length:189 start_codon:yes stop_codon:yes gene_type:complete
MSVEQNIMNIRQIIDNAGKGDNIAAGKAFDSAIADKLSAALDAEKISIASTIGKPSDTDSEE